MKRKQKIWLILLLSCFVRTVFAQTPCGGSPNQVPPAESCLDACIYCDFNYYFGTTAGYAPNGNPQGGFCSFIQNDQWIGFTAGAKSATFSITPSNCANGDGIQVALYESCDKPPLACNGGGVGQGNTPTVMTISMVPGTNYFLMIDGLSGDECDIEITVNPPNAVKAQPLGNMSPIIGPDQICAGGQFTLEVPAVANAGSYTWSGPAGAFINGSLSPVSLNVASGKKPQQVEVVLPSGLTGNLEFCVTANNSCFNGPSQCKTISVQNLLTTTLPPVLVCKEEFPYILPWGDTASTLGTATYKTTLSSYKGCDSVVQVTVTSLNSSTITFDLGEKFVCKGDALSICSSKINQNGPFTVNCSKPNSCDSIITGKLTVLDPVAKILNKSGLACSGNANNKTLYSAPSMAGTTKTWLRNGVALGTGDSLFITQPGIYTLLSKVSLGGLTCEASDEANIIVGTASQPPVLQTNVIKSISCLNKEAEFGVSSNPPALSYIWSGTGLNNFNGPILKSSTAGEYNVTVVDINGCTNTAKVLVPVDTVKPQVLSITKSPLGSIGAIKGRLITKVNINNARFNWEGPNLFSNTFQNPLVYGFGTYTVTVTNPTNGCTTTATFELTDKNKPGASKPATAFFDDTNILKTKVLDRSNISPKAAEVNKWQLFPNPSTGLVNIAYKGAHLPENVQFKVYDALGKLVYQSASNGSYIQNISLQDATPGLYVLEIIKNGSEATPPERLRFVVK